VRRTVDTTSVGERKVLCVSEKALRVVQWTTGNVGRRSVRAIASNPHLKLAGCYAWSPDKVGHDVGELSGIAPMGVTATSNVDMLLALKPDCVVYNPMWPDTDDVVRILSAGINVVTTASFITGDHLGADEKQRITDACERGGTTIFGGGINPGFAQLLAVVSAMLCDRVDKITITESGDSTLYDSPTTEMPVGFGQPIDHSGLQEMTAAGTSVFRDAVVYLADALGVKLDDIRCEAEYAQTTETLDLPGDWRIEKGCVAGIDLRWKGFIGTRDVIEIRMRWRKGQTLEPDWQFDRMGYDIEVAGQPTVKTSLDFLPPPDFPAETLADFMVLGMIITAMPAINAIPAVVAAAPGIATYNDLPLTVPRGFVNFE
jgi:2,4-diaminopentanoate dehydrogenase